MFADTFLGGITRQSCLCKDPLHKVWLIPGKAVIQSRFVCLCVCGKLNAKHPHSLQLGSCWKRFSSSRCTYKAYCFLLTASKPNWYEKILCSFPRVTMTQWKTQFLFSAALFQWREFNSHAGFMICGCQPSTLQRDRCRTVEMFAQLVPTLKK